MECYTEEIFGPVLSVMYADSLEHAIEIINANPFGNGEFISNTLGLIVQKII